MDRPRDPVVAALEQMHPGDHFCGLFNSDADHRRVVTDFIRLGIERHERIFYLVNLQTAAQLKAALAEAGIDADALIARGQLIIVTAKETYLKEGGFEPEKMMAVLEAETARAIADGYTALRTSGEMTWALSGEPGSERLLEYEARLNEFVRAGAPCYGICQYDLRRFDADLLLDVLHTHPKVLIGEHGFDNGSMYFVPPGKFVTAERKDAMLETWLANLSKLASS